MTDNKKSGSGRNFQQLKESIAQDLLALERPSDLLFFMTHGMALQAAIRISVEAGLFRRLAASTSPLSASELADGIPLANKGDDQTQASRLEFVRRLLQAMCGLKLVDEVEDSKYVYLANECTRTLARPGYEAGVRCLYRNFMGPQSLMSQMLDWATSHGYQAPNDAKDGPLQRAFNIVGTTTFTHWATTDRDSMKELGLWMQEAQQYRLNWSSWFPEAAIFGDDDSSGKDSNDGVFMVDVGGSLGHDLHDFAQRYPDKKLRLINQDQPHVIAEAKKQTLDPRIELMAHDFFAPQPVKGARIYYMHKIMHDWPDHDCVRILTQLRDVMADDSRIFINDVIIPDQGSPAVLAVFDLQMLALCSAKERSESMWSSMIQSIGGLAIRKFWQAPEMQGGGIVEIVKSTRIVSGETDTNR